MLFRLLSGFVAVSAGAGGLAMVMGPEQVSDALKLKPDDRVTTAIRVGGALVLVGAVVSLARALR